MAKPKPEAKEEGFEGVDIGGGDQTSGLMVDLNEVEDQAFECAPRGMYNCVVDELAFEYSQASGNPMWSWRLEVEDGEHIGKKFFFHTVFAGKGLPRTKKTLKAVKPDLFDAPFDPETIAANGDMIGLRVRARVDIRKYEGEDRNNVKDLYAAEEGSGDDFMS